jgi:hypothetical protein
VTTEATSYQRLREHLGYLQMTTAIEQLSADLDRALKQKLSPTQVLENLLDVGHYSRPDVFRILVDEEAKPPVAPNGAG